MSGYYAEAARADAIASEHNEAKSAFMAASARGDADAIAAASTRYAAAREALIAARAERSVAGLRSERDALVAGAMTLAAAELAASAARDARASADVAARDARDALKNIETDCANYDGKIDVWLALDDYAAALAEVAEVAAALIPLTTGATK